MQNEQTTVRVCDAVYICVCVCVCIESSARMYYAEYLLRSI